MKLSRVVHAFLVILMAAGPALAKNVDLSTVPARQSVQLTIYNSEDLTLRARDSRRDLQEGREPAAVLLGQYADRSYQCRTEVPDVAGQAGSSGRPPIHMTNRRCCIGTCRARWTATATIQITYFTSGISWSADYVCIADKTEKQMGFEGFVRVYNKSGEQYENAQIRLVVGTINLVEKIAQLAAAQQSPSGRSRGPLSELRRDAAQGDDGQRRRLFEDGRGGRRAHAGPAPGRIRR